MHICTECGLPKPSDSFRPGRDATVCGKCRYSSLTYGSVSGHAYEVKMRDKQFEKDAAAYRRLRKDGVQPKHVDGSALAETMATHKAEIEIGRDLHPTEKKALNRLNSAAL